MKVAPNNSISSKSSQNLWNIIIDKHSHVTITGEGNINKVNEQSIHTNINNTIQNISNADKQKDINPTDDQLYTLSKLEKYLHVDEQFLTFIHGGPGVGKTWTINEFKKN